MRAQPKRSRTVQRRDAEWRDALRGNFDPGFWERCGPQTPEEAAVFEREGSRVDDEWRTWIIGERDKLVRKLAKAEQTIKRLKGRK